ncbi:MFS transporter [Lentilactobacillus kisonensis]|uniref:Glycoside/pentoside/hexuronide transporter n=2 Tax=Lentilactobacillus kisonensis TaxID=481722 RepID=H1LDM5_9LACO|nr:MFS transporter [Lentilactobacillus kisonensis]EHO53135.1 glycoside/pentoside/hexuronide transporter [Lentilactobacillus kisonensis F0435]KRL20998.1 glycoside pentoside hexuronide transporter [Lentilactobacillus kisonensis DSM 19906 = JCM 15041]
MKTKNTTISYPAGSTSKKVGFLERLSYANFDFSGQLISTIVGSYLMYYFTDVALIPIAAAGTILLIARVGDAVMTPFWGMAIDLTHSKYGKARPYFLWLSIPYIAAAILLFWTPGLDTHGKILYCTIVYLIYGAFFLGINAPITTILPLLTSNPDQRVVLNSWRLVGSNLGVFVVNSLTLPLVAFFGKGNDIKGFRIFVIIFAILCLAGQLFSFFHVRERVIVPNSERVTLGRSIHAMKNNWPWFIIVLANFLFWIAQQGRQQSMVYYFTYYFNNKSLVTLFNSISIIQVVGVIAIPFFNRFMSKNRIWIMGLVGAVLGQFIIMLSGLNLTGTIIGWLIANVGSGIAVSMPFAMLGSAVDYGEWKNGVNAAGILTTIGSSFCISMGQGLAGVLNGKVMSFFGYVANHAQTAQALSGIKISFHWITIIGYGIAIIPLLMYQKYEKMEPKITSDLSKTRK